MVFSVSASPAASALMLSVTRVDVAEHGPGALVEQAVRRGDEAERGRHDVVAGLDARRADREMEPGRAGGDRGDVRGAVSRGEGGLERGEAGAESEAARAKRFEYELLFSCSR